LGAHSPKESREADRREEICRRDAHERIGRNELLLRLQDVRTPLKEGRGQTRGHLRRHRLASELESAWNRGRITPYEESELILGRFNLSLDVGDCGRHLVSGRRGIRSL